MRITNKKTLHFIIILLTLVVSITGCQASQPTSAETRINYEIGSYLFVKNTYKAETNPSFLLIRSYSAFESLFGVGMVMNADTSKLITAEKMKDKFVFSIIYHGNDIYTLGIDKIILKNNQLQVYYSSKIEQENASWSGNFHVTFLVQNCDFSSILLFENGKPLNNASIQEFN